MKKRGQEKRDYNLVFTFSISLSQKRLTSKREWGRGWKAAEWDCFLLSTESSIFDSLCSFPSLFPFSPSPFLLFQLSQCEGVTMGGGDKEKGGRGGAKVKNGIWQGKKWEVTRKRVKWEVTVKRMGGEKEKGGMGDDKKRMGGDKEKNGRWQENNGRWQGTEWEVTRKREVGKKQNGSCVGAGCWCYCSPWTRREVCGGKKTLVWGQNSRQE